MGNALEHYEVTWCWLWDLSLEEQHTVLQRGRYICPTGASGQLKDKSYHFVRKWKESFFKSLISAGNLSAERPPFCRKGLQSAAEKQKWEFFLPSAESICKYSFGWPLPHVPMIPTLIHTTNIIFVKHDIEGESSVAWLPTLLLLLCCVLRLEQVKKARATLAAAATEGRKEGNWRWNGFKNRQEWGSFFCKLT